MWSILRAKDILDLALRARGLSSSHLELLSFNKSASYLLKEEGIVVRISRPEADKDGVYAGFRLASALSEEGFPSLNPIRGIPTLEIHDSVVTFWHYEQTFPGEVDPMKAGELLRAFHDLTKDYQEELPTWRPLADAARHLRLLQGRGNVSDEDLEFLWLWQRYLEERLQDLKTELGNLPIHGNSHPRSFLQTERGLLLSDFDFFAWGPREWDLVPWGIGPRRYGKSRQSFYRFQDGYGASIMAWSGLADSLFAREFLLTTFRLLCDVGDQLSLEAKKRLAYWKKEDNSLWV